MMGVVDAAGGNCKKKIARGSKKMKHDNDYDAYDSELRFLRLGRGG
jgi:hypothetical protein